MLWGVCVEAKYTCKCRLDCMTAAVPTLEQCKTGNTWACVILLAVLLAAAATST